MAITNKLNLQPGYREAMEMSFAYFLEHFGRNQAADEKWLAEKSAINPDTVAAAMAFLAKCYLADWIDHPPTSLAS